MRFVAFDIETTGLIVPGAPWPEVTCAATRLCSENDVEVRRWHSDYAQVMLPTTINEMLDYLMDCHRKSITIISFNGASFDFQVLYGITGNVIAQRLASAHTDIMYQFLVTHGYTTSLQSFCDGIGMPGKTEKAVESIMMWATGDKERVLQYCENDVKVLGDVYTHILANGGARRRTKRGTTTFATFGFDKLWTVAVAADRAATGSTPDQSWMKNPIDLLDGVSWIWAEENPNAEFKRLRKMSPVVLID